MTADPSAPATRMARLATFAVPVAALVLAGCTAAPADEHAGHGDAQEVVALVLTAADVTHDLVIDEVGFPLEAEPGEPAEGGLRIDDPGTYTAYCSVAGHREAGMETTVTVTE